MTAPPPYHRSCPHRRTCCPPLCAWPPASPRSRRWRCAPPCGRCARAWIVGWRRRCSARRMRRLRAMPPPTSSSAWRRARRAHHPFFHHFLPAIIPNRLLSACASARACVRRGCVVHRACVPASCLRRACVRACVRFIQCARCYGARSARATSNTLGMGAITMIHNGMPG